MINEKTIKLFLGALLLIIGLIGLYAATTLPTLSLLAQNDALQYVIIEIKRNRLFTSSLILIAGLLLLFDQTKSK